jgi:hypothetical protein
MPEPLLILGLLSAGYVVLKSGNRLTPEQKAEYEELKQLYRRVPDGMRYFHRSLRYFKKRVDAYGKRGEPFVQLFDRLFADEFAKKKLPRRSSGDAELKRFRKWLDQYKDKIESRHRTFPIFADTLFEMYAHFERGVPATIQNSDPNAITVPLVEMIGNPGKVVEQILQPLHHPDVISAGLFSKARDQIKYIEGVHGKPSRADAKPRETIDAYLKPFGLDALFVGTASKKIDEKFWYGHALLLAQTRFGKTNVIRWRINQLLPRIAQGKASVILMEPKGVLTDEVLRLACVYEMRDRVVILDPKDARASVNIFDKGDGSDEAIQETIARVERVLNTVTTGLTIFQLDALTYCLRAMFYTDQPGSIRLLGRILKNSLNGLKVRQLPYAVEQYFLGFKAGDSAAMQVVNRLNGLTANPVFEALFDADKSTFNMFDEIQAGKLIVINAKTANHLYARFWIEQVSSCVALRFDLDFADRTPTTFIIDEAQHWISDDLHFASILDTAAEARIGMLIACHHMGQIKDLTVRGSIYTNTALKFAAHTSEDIHALCRSMGTTTTDFIGTLAQYEFAFFGPGSDRAMRTKLPLVEFDKMPRMTDDQYREMRANNRKRYHYVRQQQPAPSAPNAPPKPPQTPDQTKPTPHHDDGYE